MYRHPGVNDQPTSPGGPIARYTDLLRISATRMYTVGSESVRHAHDVVGLRCPGFIWRAHANTGRGAQTGKHLAVKVAAYLAFEPGRRSRNRQLDATPARHRESTGDRATVLVRT